MQGRRRGRALRLLGREGWWLHTHCAKDSELWVAASLLASAHRVSWWGGQRQGWSQGGAGPGVSGLPRGEAPVEGFTPRRSPGHRPGWSTPERVNEACGQQAWLRGLDQPGSFLPFRARSSPGLLLLQQMVGPEPGAPRSPGPLRRPRAAWWRVGGGDVAYAVLAGWPARGRPGGLTHRELRAEQNGAQLL